MLASLAVGLVVVLLMSAFFSGSETALMSVDRFRLKHLEERHPNAKRVQDVVAHPERVLGTILTGNVFVNTAAGGPPFSNRRSWPTQFATKMSRSPSPS